jgi:hypothetical protein
MTVSYHYLLTAIHHYYIPIDRKFKDNLRGSFLKSKKFCLFLPSYINDYFSFFPSSKMTEISSNISCTNALLLKFVHFPSLIILYYGVLQKEEKICDLNFVPLTKIS